MFQHDHDEELGMYWYPDSGAAGSSAANRHTTKPSATASARHRGTRETLLDGFASWLERSPGARLRYQRGNDVHRAMLVDWFLRVVLSGPR
jgi:hypothetical protein